MKKYITNTIILATLLFFFSAKITFASSIYFESYHYNSTDSNDTLIKVIFDTDNEPINAAEGKISIPISGISIKDILIKDSVINFWLDKPHVENGDKIIFSGITPGGFVGQNKTLFSFVINNEKLNNGTISFSDLKILKNSSEGLESMVKATNLTLPIKDYKKDILQDSIDNKNETIPPEVFNPFMVKDSDYYDGKKVLIFETQDKGSGIDFYEVKEGYFGKYVKANSPYVLSNQRSSKKIYIRAVDKAKNERVVEYYPSDYVYWYQHYIIIAIIFVIVAFLIKRKKWSKFIK